MSSDKRIELLLKFKALSEQGNGGEKTTANEMLNKALKKHGLTIEDLEKEEMETRTFKIKDKSDSLNVLVQCIYDVHPDAKITQAVNALKIFCDLNSSEYIEVLEKYHHYYNYWLKEKSQLFVAFLVKNRLGTDRKSSVEIDEEEQNSIIKKMEVMKDNKFIDKNLKMLN